MLIYVRTVQQSTNDVEWATFKPVGLQTVSLNIMRKLGDDKLLM